MAYWVICSWWMVWTPLTVYGPLSFVVVFARKTATPVLSSGGVFILRLQTGIEPGDTPGMEAVQVIGVGSNFYGLLPLCLFATPLTSSCPGLYLFSTSKLPLTYNFGLLRHLVTLYYAMMLFHLQIPWLTSPFYILVKVLKDGMRLVRVIIL